MATHQTEPSNNAPSIEKAFSAVRKYDRGSARGDLLALDRVLVASEREPERKRCEQELLKLLEADVSPVAKQYICSKLAIIGSGTSARALAAALKEPEVCAAALSALQTLSGTAAVKALLAALPNLTREQTIGAIRVLGSRRESGCERVLTRLLKDSQADIAAAAAAALGEVGSEEAGKSLIAFMKAAPAHLRTLAVDACLVCAQRLLAAGNRALAKRLCDVVQAQSPPAYISDAAQRINTRTGLGGEL